MRIGRNPLGKDERIFRTMVKWFQLARTCATDRLVLVDAPKHRGSHLFGSGFLTHPWSFAAGKSGRIQYVESTWGEHGSRLCMVSCEF